MVEHWAKLGRALKSANETYNAAVGSLERRVAPAVRRLEELGASSGKELVEVPALEIAPRRLEVVPEDQDDHPANEAQETSRPPAMLSSL